MMVDTVRLVLGKFPLREFGKPFILKDVMHVPGLKKNLISVDMLKTRI